MRKHHGSVRELLLTVFKWQGVGRVEEDTPEVEQMGDALLIRVGKRRRHLVLPRFLAYYRMREYGLEGERLNVWFEESRQ